MKMMADQEHAAAAVVLAVAWNCSGIEHNVDSAHDAHTSQRWQILLTTTMLMMMTTFYMTWAAVLLSMRLPRHHDGHHGHSECKHCKHYHRNRRHRHHRLPSRQHRLRHRLQHHHTCSYEGHHISSHPSPDHHYSRLDVDQSHDRRCTAGIRSAPRPHPSRLS